MGALKDHFINEDIFHDLENANCKLIIKQP